MATAVESAKGFLAQLKKTVKSECKNLDAIVLYGAPGMGKTSLAAQFKPLFVIDGSDNGYLDLVRNGQLPEGYDPIMADSWEKLRTVTKELIEYAKNTPDADKKFRSVCFENLGGFATHLREVVIAKYRKRPAKGDDESYDTALIRFNAFGGYSGAKDSLPEWEAWLQDIVTLGHHGIRPLLLGHATNGKSDSADQTSAFARMVLDIHPELSKVVDRLMGNVGLITMKPVIVAAAGAGKKARVDENAEARVLKMFSSPQFQGKNRYGIQTEIDMGTNPGRAWRNLARAMGANIPEPEETGE